jgi:hypothetical protein
MQPERHPNTEHPFESLEARLRSLPPAVIPADLEERLLATVPAAERPRPRRRQVWPGLAVALAAACLLAILVWQGRQGKKPVPRPNNDVIVQPVQPHPQDAPADAVTWREARRDLNVEQAPAFTWPLAETAPIQETKSIPPDLLN